MARDHGKSTKKTVNKNLPSADRTTLIRVSDNTYERLRAIGVMGESFDDVIVRLLNDAEKK